MLAKSLSISHAAERGCFQSMQFLQQRHDAAFHQDIACLPTADRLKHMALHFSKYVGKIAETCHATGDTSLKRTMVDSFIIVLATANTLNLALDRQFEDLTKHGVRTLRQIGLDVAENEMRDIRDDAVLLGAFAVHTGRFAKACEAIDHVEAFPIRQSLTEELLGLLRVVLAASAVRGIDLYSAMQARHREIEVNHPLHARDSFD